MVEDGYGSSGPGANFAIALGRPLGAAWSNSGFAPSGVGCVAERAKPSKFHELCHAVLNTTGKQIFNDDQTENERMVIGLAPFNQVQHVGRNRQYTENVFRAAIALAPRPSL